MDECRRIAIFVFPPIAFTFFFPAACTFFANKAIIYGGLCFKVSFQHFDSVGMAPVLTPGLF